jgi:hypothetical protein
MGMNELIAQGSTRVPAWNLFETERNALVNQGLRQELQYRPENQNFLRKKMGWAEEDRATEQQQRPLNDHAKALAILTEEADMIDYEIWDESKAFLEKNGLRPGLLPSKEYFERQAPKGVSPQQYFDAWKDNFIGKSKRQLDQYKAETERFKAGKESLSTPEKQMRDYEMRKRAMFGYKIDKIKNSYKQGGVEISDEEAEGLLTEKDQKQIEDLKATYKIGAKGAVEKEATPTQLAKLIEEMNALPEGDPSRSLYQAAIAKAVQQTGMQVTVDKDGTVRVTQGPIGAGGGGMTPTTKTAVQTKLFNATEQISRLRSIEQKFKPQFQEFGTRGQAWWLGAKAKMGRDLSSGDTQLLTEFGTYKQDALENINMYIKEITGAQMSEKEADRIRKAMPDPGEGILDGDDPISFKAKLDNTMKKCKLAIVRYQMLLSKGLTPEVIQQMVQSDTLPPIESAKEFINEKAKEKEKTLKTKNPDMSESEIKVMVVDELKEEFGI